MIINGRISFRRRRLLMMSDGRSIFLGTATASVSDEEKQSSRCLRLWSRSRSSIRWRLPGCKLPTKQSLVAGYCDGKKCPQETFVRTISRATSKFATQTLPQLGQLTQSTVQGFCSPRPLGEPRGLFCQTSLKFPM